MDILSKDQRHKNMVAIHSANTKPEMIVRNGTINEEQARLSEQSNKSLQSICRRTDIEMTSLLAGGLFHE